MAESKEGIVYALTNEGMHDQKGNPLVKIGLTEETTVEGLKKRVLGLYTTGVPFLFTVRYAVRVKDVGAAENLLHKALEFASHRVNPRREFFDAPLDSVIAAMNLLMIQGVEVIDFGDDSSGEGGENLREDVEARDAQARKNRPPFEFGRWGIPVGAVLTYRYDRKVEAVVVDDKSTVRFEGENMQLSKAAQKAYGCDYGIAGAEYWGYTDPKLKKWELLRDRRKRLEEEGE